MPKHLTPHFTLDEFIVSQTAARKGIDNTPSPEVVRNLLRVATFLEDIRTLLVDAPILVSSGYRCAELNRAIGGAKNSRHLLGLAVDFTVPSYGSVLKVARTIAGSNLAYDQVIYEYGAWVHVGLAPLTEMPRLQKLSIFRGSTYVNGIVTKIV